MARNFQFAVDEYYHVYNRGVDKRIVFQNVGDKVRFQKLLYVCNGAKTVHLSELAQKFRDNNLYMIERGDQLVDIGAYCLMDNHFHLLLRECVENGTSLFMQKLITAYTMYFNILYDRTGALFGGRFKAQHIQNDVHLKYLFAYIHLNAKDLFTNQKGLGTLRTYRFSSLSDHLKQKRSAGLILNTDRFPGYFKDAQDILSELNEWLDFDKSNNFKVQP